MNMNRIEDSYKDKVEWYRDNKGIEISSKEYWKMMDYHSGLMYCSLLLIDGKDDWRMLKDVEEIDEILDDDEIDVMWYIEDIIEYAPYLDMRYWVIPVRDLLAL
jgi:hypothetical protein